MAPQVLRNTVKATLPKVKSLGNQDSSGDTQPKTLHSGHTHTWNLCGKNLRS